MGLFLHLMFMMISVLCMMLLLKQKNLMLEKYYLGTIYFNIICDICMYMVNYI